MTLCVTALRQRPLLAQSGHQTALNRCPLLGVKRTLLQLTSMSVIDPKQTLAVWDYGGAT